MLIGHLMSVEEISRIDTKRLDELTKIALDALVESSTIDEQIRQNPVIMKELSTVVARALKPGEKRE